MKAGIDFGSSLIKIVWEKNNCSFAIKTPTFSEAIIQMLHDDGITSLHIGGIAAPQKIDGFTVMKKEGDPIRNEIELQANDVRKLLPEVKDFLLVSFGTGISYTAVTKDTTTRFPLGSSIGGGFIKGSSELLEIPQESLVSGNGAHLDLLIKDKLPELTNTIFGERPIAHFGKATKDAKKEDIAKSLLNCAGILVVKDVFMLDQVGFAKTKNIVYIGTCISELPALRKIISDWTNAIEKKPYFPQSGEYALAWGLYHMEEKQ